MKTISVGRDHRNDIVINEPGVSRQHALLTVNDDGTIELKDLNSANGTFVNEARVQKVLLSPGNTVRVATVSVDWQSAVAGNSSRASAGPIDEKPFYSSRRSASVGSDPQNDIVVDQPFVSKHHASISCGKKGNYFIRDLGSSNGTFVNGARVNQKNFSKTDAIRLANTDLPADWHRHKNLQRAVYRRNPKGFALSVTLLVLFGIVSLGYVNRRAWFGWDLTLTPKEIFAQNRNSIVRIQHDYYFTIVHNGKKYYVGKNKNFVAQTEANTDPQQLLPYGSVSGDGVIVSKAGAILTTPDVAYPWTDPARQSIMLREVLLSRTLPGLTSGAEPEICGTTAVLKWIAAGSINNEQNYTEATAPASCTAADSTAIALSSVKAVSASINPAKPGRFLRDKPDTATTTLFVGKLEVGAAGELIGDTIRAFSVGRQNMLPAIVLPAEATVELAGDPVFNHRGELIGLRSGDRIIPVPAALITTKH